MNRLQPVISFVSPVYQSESTLRKLVEEIDLVMSRIGESYEIILIDDRSTDNSWNILRELSRSHSDLKIARLSRNFGQHPAIMAGLSLAQGKWIVVMDCDLQDQPKEVEKLYNKALEGYEVVLGKRTNRQDSWFKKISSLIFAKVYFLFTDVIYDNEVANFGIYHEKVIKAILTISDYIKFFPLFVKFVGFKTISIDVEHQSRLNGKSSYSFTKLISLMFNTIISFSNKPLKIFVKFGILISFLSFLVGFYYLYLAITNQIEVLGFSSIIISLWFLAGIIITIIGVIGIYLGKVFNQVKGRPVFIIEEML